MSRRGRSKPRALIISPTRELAEQLAEEARKVAARTGVIVETAVGGTRKNVGLARIHRFGCDVLIGTPGRLSDLLSMGPEFGIDMPDLGTLVLDEADRLLDDGFWPEIRNILSYLPEREDVDRQTLLFSATAPAEVMDVVRDSLKPGYKFIKTVRDDEVPTHMKVPQKVVWMNGFENALPTVLDIAKTYMRDQSQTQPFKAIVYFNTTAEVELAEELFSNLVVSPELGYPLGRRLQIYGLQSRLTQAKRTMNSDGFRKASSAILFSSSLTARGMDFPNVTHVIQVGLPRTRPDYIHRIGRTGRADKSGQAWLLLVDGLGSLEKVYRSRLGDLPIETANIKPANVDLTEKGALDTSPSCSQVKQAMASVPNASKAIAYRALSNQATELGNSVTAKRKLQDLLVYGYGLTGFQANTTFRDRPKSRPPQFRDSNRFADRYDGHRGRGRGQLSSLRYMYGDNF